MEGDAVTVGDGGCGLGQQPLCPGSLLHSAVELCFSCPLPSGTEDHGRCRSPPWGQAKLR